MAKTYEPIATATLGSAGNFSFTSIPSTYTDLQLVVYGISDTPSVNTVMYFNNDTATNYSYVYFGSYPSGFESFERNNWNGITPTTSVTIGNTYPTLIVIDIFSYKNTSSHKSVLSKASMKGASTTGSTAGGWVLTSGLWRSTAAINRVDFAMGNYNYTANSTATLFGIMAA